MRTDSLSKLGAAELIALFVDLSRDQGQALTEFQTRKYNRLFDKVKQIETEFRSRSDSERDASFRPLLGHPNVKVKMNAAYVLLDIAKDDALATLKWVAESRIMPFCADARGSVEAIEEDDFPRGSNPNSIYR